jgi:Na+/phosphate symporter
MPRKKISAAMMASRLAKIALRVLKRFPEAEQEKRIRAAERRIKIYLAKLPHRSLTASKSNMH